MAKTGSRSATASIRGYLYQTVLAAQAWLALEPGETLVVEGDEDYDVLLRGSDEDHAEQVSTQVKDRAEQIVSLETPSLRRSLAAFARTYAERDGKVRFVYVTTQSRKTPSKGEDHVAAWVKGRDLDSVAAEVARIAANRDWEIPWPDGEPDWRGFVESVELSFDREPAGRERAELEDRISNHPRTGEIADVGALAERILDDLWQASAENDLGLRRRSAEDLGHLVDEVKSTLAAWSRSPRARRIRGWLDAREALGKILHDGTRTLREKPHPSQLLDARYEVIPFLEDARRRLGRATDRRGLCRDPSRTDERGPAGR